MFTYDPTLPTPKDRVRHSIGDVTEPGYRSDETINALLAEYTEVKTTIILADSLAAEFAMMPSSLSGPDGSMTWGDRVTALQALAKRLQLESDEDLVNKATDKLRSFAPVRAGNTDEIAEYRRPIAPIFWDRNGNYWWGDE